MKYKVNKNKRAFTLIELVAVLVILAIIALIVTPLVMNIVKKAKDSANKRSVDAYGKAVELAASNYLLETGKKANSFDVLNVEYTGNKVNCEIKEVYKNEVFLSQCKVGNTSVKDSSTTDGYYHYGKESKFVDIYGDLVTKAVKKYVKQNGELPNNISDLEINSNGLNVKCAQSKINSDQSVYLSECSLGNIVLLDGNTNDRYYQYGEIKILIGDVVNYNGIDFYVIENVDNSSKTVHLMKTKPITQGEIKDYLSSTELEDYISIYNSSSYLSMKYLYSDTCTSLGASEGTNTGCSVNYSTSSVKQILDVWGNVYLNDEDLVKDSTGYKVRLLIFNDLLDELGFYYGDISITSQGYKTDLDFMKSIRTMTMIQSEDSNNSILELVLGSTSKMEVYHNNYVVPVINIKISALLK